MSGEDSILVRETSFTELLEALSLGLAGDGDFTGAIFETFMKEFQTLIMVFCILFSE